MKITENSLISLGLVSVLLGGVGWLTHLAWVSESNAEALQVVMDKQEVYNNRTAQIDQQLAVINEKLSRIEKSLQELKGE